MKIPAVDGQRIVLGEPYLAIDRLGCGRLVAGALEEDLEALALASDKVQRSIDGADIRKVIVVPDRLVNIVTG